MPIGLIVMTWDERVGTEITAKYPEEIQVQTSSLMQVYSQHEFTGEAGMVSFISGPLNVASYYTGPDTMFYIILLLEVDEDADAYEEGLADISRQVLMNQEDNAYKEILPSLFQRVSVYPKLNKEQRMAMIYQNEIKRMTINRLREEAVITKAELGIWLKDRYQEGFFDLESILVSLIKTGMVNVASVQGISSELVFLVRDIMISRVPPVKLFKDIQNRGLPGPLKESYQTEVRNFFKQYRVTEEDSLKILEEVILDPQVYETLHLLRVAAVTRDDLEKLTKKGVEDVDYVLKKLWENKIIQVFQDNSGNEYYCLSSDFHISTFFPDYLLDKVRKAYRTKSQSNDSLIQELEMLKEEYWQMKDESKKGRKTKEIEA